MEAEGFGEIFRAEDESVDAGGEDCGSGFGGFAVDPEAGGFEVFGEGDGEGGGLGELDFGGDDGVLRVCEILGEEAAVDGCGHDGPGEFRVAFDGGFGVFRGCGEDGVNFGSLAVAGGELSGFAEAGEELEEIVGFLRGEGADEVAGHEAARVGFGGDIRVGDGDLLARAVADDGGAAGTAEELAGDGLPVLGLDDDGVVAFLDFCAGIHDGFDEVIHRSAGTDGGHVGADLAARAADGVAGDAGEGGAAVDEFAAPGVAFLGGAPGHRGDIVGLRGGGSGLGAEQGEEGVVLGDFRDVLKGKGGDFRGQGFGFECCGELFGNARCGEGFLPEISRCLWIGKGGGDGCDERQRGLAVVAGEGEGGEAADGWLGVRGEFFQDVAGGG